ncbi:phage tail sheath subtilisin-like domain-containing protein [Brevibacillus choshinensis]|uniref:Phage tail sheath subtilisin-like domain-containing protein n=1 Tax=Brevibacillus choshinensis TaxID=54911 RepID=A0ABX7FQT0_BRECH|nr:phage tail sheath subtilisin-like domain-containing protein [Brevibacillus choshinensis]QRG68598.1 phage tail sheath subtilisin-like domain-containing protein [Brevibacillus choshinensis]
MSINRERPGVTVELIAKAQERVEPKSGVVLVPYQSEWGSPNTAIKMAGYEERYKETLALVDTVELAAAGGATVLGYRVTNGNEVSAKYVQANAIEIAALYPGTYGNNLRVTIAASSAEPGKKELQVKDETGVLEKFSFADADELVKKTVLSNYVRAKKLGTDAVTDATDAQFTGGMTGTAPLTSADFTKIFNAVSGSDFDTLYLPSDDAAVQAAAKQFIADRRTLSKKLSTLVIGGKEADDLDMTKHTERSVSMNARYVVNSAIAGEHNNGKTYNSVQWAAWVAGMIAATPADQSLTAIVVPLKRAAKDWGHTEILNALSTGTLIATRDGDVYIIESAVNTLSTIGPNEREDYGKIRVSMTIDQIMNDLMAAGKKYKGKLDNNDLGGAVFVGAVKAYLIVREQQGAIDTGWTFTDKKNGVGDRRGFLLSAKPLDAIENFDVDWEVL